MLRTLVFVCGVAAVTPVCAMSLTSKDIADGKEISAAQIYPRCGGQNISPALSWSDAPPGTESYVVTMIDLDVKPSGWSHWIVVNIPRNATSLASGARTVVTTRTGTPSAPAGSAPQVPAGPTMPEGAVSIFSNFGEAFYDGPCPPPGTGTHHYQVTVWAMPAPVFNDIYPDEKASEVMFALQRAALASASITGFVTAPGKAR